MEYKVENIELIHGDKKTNIVVKFDYEGNVIAHEIRTEPVIGPLMTTLKEDLNEALEDEDWERVKETQRRINMIRET